MSEKVSHAPGQRCAPLGLLLMGQGMDNSMIPLQPGAAICPMCHSGYVSEIRIFGLELDDIDQAVELRRREAKDGDINQAEASYLLTSQSHSSGLSAEAASFQRTGRWTDDEISYVDFLLEAFDHGRLVLPMGVRLNDFLAEMLLCKSSRLTKKMKNAKLSVRSYEVSFPNALDVQLMSSLEQKFLDSITSEATRLELKFNMTKAWRSHFSNLSLQIGSSLVDARDWVSSLETMERRAAMADETIRKARRQRMGLALKTDVRTSQPGVFFAGVSVKRPPSAREQEVARAPFTPSAHVTSSGSESDFISDMLDIGLNEATHNRVSSEDFTKIFHDFAQGEPEDNIATTHVRNNAGPFLDEMVSYIEANDLPFQHVDVWVPSFSSGEDSGDSLRLFHAGHASRSDLDPGLFCQMYEYGEYSTKFSFAPGVGLPGRVFATGEPTWERRIDEADPTFFERAGGAKVYGIKTGFGMALRTNSIGNIVVSMYSTVDLPRDDAVIDKCAAEFARYTPEPKWKLVVEMGDSGASPREPKPPALKKRPAPVELVHHRHGSVGSDSVMSETPTEYDIEQRIAAILGDHLPLAELPDSSDSKFSRGAPVDLLPHFMSLRLTLLRSPTTRSKSENETLDIIKKSYVGYSKDSQRSEQDLAILLAKDWQYLKASSPHEGDLKPAARPRVPSDLHQCHVMDVPRVRTYSATGAPTMMPTMLSYVPPPSVHGSPGSPMGKKQRVDSNVRMEFMQHNQINIVDDSS